ncbi:gastrula zinc finger protein XlCGF57.1-like isoform X3 [Periplaneta americana]|uniref:gastrula zinc finger protein XlCGF57.1-like isoform X3 n=1 Tax=Periplaneta americana TaxID=6978 RepID=UPI0037E9A271
MVIGLCSSVVMDGIKTEPDVDPLALQNHIIGNGESLLMVGNSLKLGVDKVKMESFDPSYGDIPGIKVEENEVTYFLPAVKAEAEIEEETWNEDIVKEEHLPDVTKENDGSTERPFPSNSHDDRESEYAQTYIEQTEQCSDGRHFKCELCGKGFTKQRNLKQYQHIHSDEKRFKCNVCDKGFTYRCDLERHTSTHTNNKPFKCKICAKCFIQRYELRRHEFTHTREKFFKCNECEKSFKLQHHLRIHTLTHTAGEKVFKCNICMKGFRQPHSLKGHMRLHSKDKLSMHNCGETCETNDINYINTYNEESAYKCDFCSESFWCKRNLGRHILKHTGEKPFKCDICDKRFVYPSSLKVHKRIHTGEKPYRCDLCHRNFRQRNHLKVHVCHKVKKKKFKCDILE